MSEDQKSQEQFRKDIAQARSYVSSELRKNGINVNTRLLTTISVMTSIAMNYIDEKIGGSEAREGFDKAIRMYRDDDVPF